MGYCGGKSAASSTSEMEEVVDRGVLVEKERYPVGRWAPFEQSGSEGPSLEGQPSHRDRAVGRGKQLRPCPPAALPRSHEDEVPHPRVTSQPEAVDQVGAGRRDRVESMLLSGIVETLVNGRSSRHPDPWA